MMCPPVSLGRYKLLFPVGHGGMSDVYLALVNSAVGVHKLLVVKQLRASLLDDSEALSMFMDEGRLAARLHHPNVVQTFEVGHQGPIPYMTMEFLDGQPLHRVLRRLRATAEPEQPLELGMRLRIMTEMLEGLHYAHELRDYDGAAMNVVHRDVSPQNLFITYDGQIKLVDFGIAKASDSVTQTEGRGLKGKLAYMSPQQANGDPVDRRTDVFAAGVMLWEMLGDRRLWDGCNEATVARRLVDHDLPDLALADVPERLLAICKRALAPAADDRYPTAEQFRQELERYMTDAGLDVSPRVSPRVIGKRVAAAFAVQRAEIRARIDQELRALVGDGPAEPVALWREPYRGGPLEQTLESALDSDHDRAAEPDEVTADYGPVLDGLANEAPPRPELRREASGIIEPKFAPSSPAPAPAPRSPSRGAIGLILGLALLVLVPLLWSALPRRAPSPSSSPSPPEQTVDPELPTAPLPGDCDAPNKPKVRLSGEIDKDATLTCERDYVLTFITNVAPGVTLTIEPGTTLFGDRETKGTLVVLPGARLIAEGTRERPIVFTSEQPEGERRPGDWGGVILLGRAPINLRNAAGEPIRGAVEGLTSGGRYGGDDPDDDSGVLRYVRIEYSGSELAPANEVNGLTLAGVGRGTTLDHIQVRFASDDCFEFFGGTVDAKHLVCDMPGDDGLDFDHGYQGRIQFAVIRDRPEPRPGYGEDDEVSHGIEIDNDPTGSPATPRTRPQVWNATLCGAAQGRSPSFGILVRKAALAELGGLVIGGFDYALDVRDVHTGIEINGLALIDQPLAEPGKPDDDAGFDEARWLADPTRAPLLDVSGFPGCGGPMPASMLPSAPLVPPRGFTGPPDDGFFDPEARWLGAFAGPDDDWTAGWVVWSD